MGCDIHSWIEVRPNPSSDEWKAMNISVEPLDNRHYGLFGWLADVRNYSAIQPLKYPKGMPSNADIPADLRSLFGMCGHGASWYTLEEFEAVDFNRTVEDRRITADISYRYPGGCTVISGGETAETGEGKKIPLLKFLAGSDIFMCINIMQQFRQALDLPSDCVRVVFFFDC
jgi:hypothetical protein